LKKQQEYIQISLLERDKKLLEAIRKTATEQDEKERKNWWQFGK